MEFAFHSKTLRGICENEAQARRALGPNVAQRLKHRLADMQAAQIVKELVAGKPFELDGTRRGQISVDLGDRYRIIFCANHNANPTTESGSVDWSKVTRIKIINIECNDGK